MKMADNGDAPFHGQSLDVTDPVSTDADPWASLQSGHSSLSGSSTAAPRSRSTASSDCSSKHPEDGQTKYDGVIIHHKEEGRLASTIMKKLKERYPDLRLKLYGDLRSTGIYRCLEKTCKVARNIIELWTPKYEVDEQCMDMSRSLKAHNSYTSVCDRIVIVSGFADDRKPTKDMITLNDAMPLYFFGDDDDEFYTTLRNRLLGDEDSREEKSVLPSGSPPASARQETAPDLHTMSDTYVKRTVDDSMLPEDVTLDASIKGGEEAEGRISKARSALGLQQAEGGAEQPADPGFSAVPPPPGDASSQQGRGREGDSPAEGRQRERPQQPALVDTEPALRQPWSVQQGAASEMNPGTSVDSVPVCSDLRMNASKSQKTSLDSESFSYVYESNLNTLATQGDCDTVGNAGEPPPSLANPTSRENQMQESGGSPFSQTKDASLDHVPKDAPSCIKPMHQASSQDTLPPLQNSPGGNTDECNRLVRGPERVLEDTVEEVVSHTTGLSEETDPKEPLRLHDYYGQRMTADEEREIKHKALTKEEKPHDDDDEEEEEEEEEEDGGGFKTRSQVPLPASPTGALGEQSERTAVPDAATPPAQHSITNTQEDYDLNQLPFIDSEDEPLHRERGIFPVPTTKLIREKQRGCEAVPSGKPRTDRMSTQCSETSVESSAGFEVHADRAFEKSFLEECPQNQLLSREGDAEGFQPLRGPSFPPHNHELGRSSPTFRTPIQESQAFTNQPCAVQYGTDGDQVPVPLEHSRGQQGAKFVDQSTLTSKPPSPTNTTIINALKVKHLNIGLEHISRMASHPHQATGSAGPPGDTGITSRLPQSPAPFGGQDTRFPRDGATLGSCGLGADSPPDGKEIPPQNNSKRQGIFRFFCCGVIKEKKQAKRGRRKEDTEKKA